MTPKILYVPKASILRRFGPKPARYELTMEDVAYLTGGSEKEVPGVPSDIDVVIWCSREDAKYFIVSSSRHDVETVRNHVVQYRRYLEAQLYQLRAAL